LFDLQGRRVRQSSLQEQRSRIDLTGLPAGVYVYTVEEHGQRKSGKLVKE
jgi:hypothetical protein